MKRLTIYKRKRNGRRIVLFVVFVFILISALGITIVDNTVNSMLSTNDEFKIISITKKAESIYEMNIMNCGSEINLTYINKDIAYVSDKVKELYKKASEQVFNR